MQQNVAASIVQAVSITHNPQSPPQQRAEAVQFFEQLKCGEIHTVLQAAGTLAISSTSVEVQLVAYSLLIHLVKNRWQELNANEQQELVALGFNYMRSVGSGGTVAYSIRSKVAALLAGAMRQLGRQGLEAYLQQLLLAADAGHMQAETCCLVLAFMSEDLTQFEEAGGNLKRQFLQALTASLNDLLPFFNKLLEKHFNAAVERAQAGDMAAAKGHAAAVTAALNALQTFAEWVPMPRLVAHNVVQGASFLLNTIEFRLPALDILRKIVGRKKATEAQEPYQELMGRALLALLEAGERAFGGGGAELGPEGPLEEYGLRLCGALGVAAEGHLQCVPQLQDKFRLLQLMLMFLGHQHLLLAAEALPFWTHLLREAVAAVQNPAKPESKDALVPPPDACQALFEVLGRQLPHVVLHAEEAGQVPFYFDTPSEFKDFANSFRSSAKAALRLSASLAPDQALGTASSFLTAALAVATDKGQRLARRHVHMEAAVFYLEAVVGVLLDSPRAPALADQVAAPLQLLLSFQDPDPINLCLLVRGLEAFARLLPLRPQLAMACMDAVYRLIALLPLPHPAQQPPPPVLSPEYKSLTTARMCLAKVPLALAKTCPEAFAPQLQTLVTRVQEAWKGGGIMEGERLHLCECILAAAMSMGLDTQQQALQWVLGPIQSEWTSPLWQQHLASPTTFAQHYMAFRQLPDSSIEIGSREERWALYHQVIILERALRRTPRGAPLQEGAPPPQHAFTPHLEWAMVPLARIIYCLNGLWSPQMQAALAPLAEAFKMDPVERALRAGEDREAAKKDVEPSSVAGAGPAGLRHWLRGMREAAAMILAHLGAHCTAMWASYPLAAALPPAMVSFMENMEHRHLRVLLRHVAPSWLASCPPHLRGQWLAPLLSTLLPHMHSRLTTAWGALISQQQTGKENAAEATEEVVNEALLRDVTRDYIALLQLMACPKEGPAAAGTSSARSSETGGAPLDGGLLAGNGHSNGMVAEAQPHSGDLVMSLMWQADRAAATAAAATATAALCWPDTESTRRAAAVCRFFVALAEQTRDGELLGWVAGDMLRASMGSITMVSTAAIQSEVLGLAKAILLLCLPGVPATRQVLLSLPNVTPQVLEQFEAALAAKGGEKAGRDAIKALLLEAGGEELRPLLAVTSLPKLAVTNVQEPKAAREPKMAHEEAEDDWWGQHTSLQW